jgi:hypothetical protein
VRKREEHVAVREENVQGREKRVWAGFQQLARGKAGAACRAARWEELKGGRGGDADADEKGKGRGERQWWVKGWWGFSD